MFPVPVWVANVVGLNLAGVGEGQDLGQDRGLGRGQDRGRAAGSNASQVRVWARRGFVDNRDPLTAASGQLPQTICQYGLRAELKFARRQARIPDRLTNIAGTRGIVSDHHRTVQHGTDVARQSAYGYTKTGTDVEGV